ncbi:hypothetical protein DFJ74DRAFT_719404 [Hyaloraphidium curvatum]|nr:hypothetical protein DFJ74DRAFT_719404 [Hyaloraphidium curvatum]
MRRALLPLLLAIVVLGAITATAAPTKRQCDQADDSCETESPPTDPPVPPPAEGSPPSPPPEAAGCTRSDDLDGTLSECSTGCCIDSACKPWPECFDKSTDICRANDDCVSGCCVDRKCVDAGACGGSGIAGGPVAPQCTRSDSLDGSIKSECPSGCCILQSCRERTECFGDGGPPTPPTTEVPPADGGSPPPPSPPATPECTRSDDIFKLGVMGSGDERSECASGCCINGACRPFSECFNPPPAPNSGTCQFGTTDSKYPFSVPCLFSLPCRECFSGCCSGGFCNDYALCFGGARGF